MGCELVSSSHSGDRIFHPEEAIAVANVPQHGDFFSDVCWYCHHPIFFPNFFPEFPSSWRSKLMRRFGSLHTTSLQFNGEKLWTPQVPSALMGVLFQHDDFSPDIAGFVMFILWIFYCNFSTTWGIKYGTFCMKLIVLIFFRAHISWRCQYYSYWRIATGQIKSLLNFVDCDCTVEVDATMTGLQ